MFTRSLRHSLLILVILVGNCAAQVSIQQGNPSHILDIQNIPIPKLGDSVFGKYINQNALIRIEFTPIHLKDDMTLGEIMRQHQFASDEAEFKRIIVDLNPSLTETVKRPNWLNEKPDNSIILIPQVWQPFGSPRRHIFNYGDPTPFEFSDPAVNPPSIVTRALNDQTSDLNLLRNEIDQNHIAFAGNKVRITLSQNLKDIADSLNEMKNKKLDPGVVLEAHESTDIVLGLLEEARKSGQTIDSDSKEYRITQDTQKYLLNKKENASSPSRQIHVAPILHHEGQAQETQVPGYKVYCCWKFTYDQHQKYPDIYQKQYDKAVAYLDFPDLSINAQCNLALDYDYMIWAKKADGHGEEASAKFLHFDEHTETLWPLYIGSKDKK